MTRNKWQWIYLKTLKTGITNFSSNLMVGWIFRQLL